MEIVVAYESEPTVKASKGKTSMPGTHNIAFGDGRGVEGRMRLTRTSEASARPEARYICCCTKPIEMAHVLRLMVYKHRTLWHEAGDKRGHAQGVLHRSLRPLGQVIGDCVRLSDLVMVLC